MKNKNMEMLLNTLGNIEITEGEQRTLEWLSGWETSSIENICNLINKTKKRGAGRKKQVDVQAIRSLKEQGMSQEKIARQLNISISTVRRNL